MKSLTLKGFKSFAQPTVFAFEPGVTCVVGPNGSGKSNVVDALAWVMGEQGAKTLRGGKMEDVIFAGTSSRGPLGRAEVTLTIDNSDGALPIEYSEVTISRTLFRNGGSEYAINGQGCRLLDVQELLSDSGLGREMHVIVGQGQLDAVLRATPEDRRGYIEEAAGILKHRRRKEKTVRKLEAMQTNLTRLSDLAGEIRRQLKPLGRQAEVAREAQTIAAVVRDARARLLADEVVTLRAQLSEMSKSESERKTERLVLQEQLDQAKLRQGRLEQSMSGDEVDAHRRLAFGLEQAQDRLRSLSSMATQRLTLLSQQSELPGMSATVSTSMIEDAREEAVRLQGEVTVAEAALGKSGAVTATARANLDALDEEISAQSALVSQHDLEQARLGSQVELASSRLAAAQQQVERQRTAATQAEERREQARAEFLAVDGDEAAPEGDAQILAEQVTEAEAEAQRLEGEVDELRDALHTAERERDALAARVSALTMAADQRSGSGAIAEVDGIRGPVSDAITVEQGWEASIAAALGSLAEAVLADSREAALAALEHVHRTDAGQVEIVVADARADAGPTDLPQGARSAIDLVEAPDGIRGLLARVVIVDDLDAARAAWPVLRELDGVTVITHDGDVLGEHVLRGGTGGARSRLELLAERDDAQERLVAVSTEIERSGFELGQRREALATARTAAREAAARQKEFDAELAARSQALGRSRVQLEAAEAEAERLGDGIAALAEAVREATTAAERAQAEHDEHAATPRPILDVSARDSLLLELESARQNEVELRVQLETARERVRAQKATAEQLQKQLEAERAAAEEAARVAVLRRHQIETASAVLEALPPAIAVADRSVAQARERLAVAERERAEQNEELSGLRAAESGLREKLAGLNENVHSLEMQAYEKKLHLSQLLERAAGELGLDEDVLVVEYGPDVPVPVDVLDAVGVRDARAESGDDAGDEDLDGDDDLARGGADGVPADSDTADEDGADVVPAAESEAAEDPADSTADIRTVPFVRREQQTRLAAAERKLGLLGRVNPLALEEFAALEQRHKFLVDQLADLTKTRKDLTTIIEEIDEKMQDIFASAFEDTKAAFNRVFPILFPGGTGSILLTNPDDMLTTGIEVAVKPAGKKIERLSLLSGGERSLAAVALLIAIFKARPSPFYIMDEVEAALDDANLGRLLTIFDDLRQSSQLIVITHQKRTMEIADALYGVSMRQDGVSAVVGQRVQTEADREKARAELGRDLD
nr:AAA family ATPase [Schumannella luteola]